MTISGLSWDSYASNDTINAGNLTGNPTQLYENAITFFNSPKTKVNTGIITTIQSTDYTNIQTDNPPFTIFTNDATYTAVQFSGFFIPDQTGIWTFNLGYDSFTSDDFAMLFIGTPGTEIIPNTTFTGTSSVPDSNIPVIYNIYWPYGNYSATLSLVAGQTYPMLINFSQTQGGYVLGFSFQSPNSTTTITDFTGYIVPTLPNISCFKEGTKILTLDGYQKIEDLKSGDLIKTKNNSFVPIYQIGYRKIFHPATNKRIKNQLYYCSPRDYLDLFEPLVITGCHSILVDEFDSVYEKEQSIIINEQIYITDNKYRVPVCVDKRSKIYETPGEYMIYHISLENDDYYMNYGIYANGLLVESCSKKNLSELSEMTIKQ